MKNIQWRVALTDDNKIASLEDAIGFDLTKVESHLIIIGLLENLKSKHQEELKSLYKKRIGNSPDRSDL
jgi:hypothetical protein